MKDFIERLRAKPESERKRIALATSVGTTALIAILWASATVSSGTLALKSSSSNSAGAGAVGEVTSAVAQSQNSFSNLLGAVAAFQNASSSAALKIEDVPQEKPAQSGPDTRTVIPF